MNSSIAISIPTRQFVELVDFLREKNDPRDPVEIVGLAIDYWLTNADFKPELLREVEGNIQGYQWKSLFLPNGTRIRMQYKGSYFYAKVEGDKIIYNEKPTSPAQLVNTITGTSRNAWRDLWIKRPEDMEWKSADACRPEMIELGNKLLQELDPPAE